MSMASKKNPPKANPQSLDARFKAWADEFLHSPIGFDGKKPEDIIRLERDEAKRIFKQELPKRKAQDEFKKFLTKDGLELSYWFIKKVEEPSNKNVKILVHGSGSNFAKAARAIKLLDRGFNVAMISYRGHSGNPGKADQKTIKRDVFETIKNIMELGYSIENIHLEGSSLGTSILAHVMNRFYQELGFEYQCASLILKAAPLNLTNRSEDTLKSMKDFGIDFDRTEPLLKKLWNQEEPYSRIKAKEIKIVHGAKDDVVPAEHASQIKTLLDKNNQKVSLEILQGEGHYLDLSNYGIY